MNNSSPSDYYGCVDHNTPTISNTDPNKIEPDDDDNNNNYDITEYLTNRNYTSDNITSPAPSDILLQNTGPMNPNSVTTVTSNSSNLNEDITSDCSENYQEIGPVKKPVQSRYQHLHRYHKQQQKHHHLVQPTSSFSQQMYCTTPYCTAPRLSSESLHHSANTMPLLNYSSHSHHHHPHRHQSNYNYQEQSQQQHYSSNMMNPALFASTSTQHQEQELHQQPHQYIKQEPLFRPPPTSAYYQNYYSPPPRQNLDYTVMYGPHQQAPPPSHMLLYSHHHQSGFGPSSIPPIRSSTNHSHHHRQHSQFLSTTPTGRVGLPFSNRHHEQMMNALQFSNSNGREARNRAEKQRRDKLNGSIADLATMVPHVAESPRRVDKTAVLRYSAHGLRLRYVFGKTVEQKSVNESGSGLLLTDSLTKLLDGFLLTITCRGQIVIITPSVEQHLGHCQSDLFGQNILHITHPDDHQMLKQQLIPTDLDQLLDIQNDENGEPRPRTQEEENVIDRRLLADKRNFTVRLARATPRSEPTSYEIVKIDGCFRRADSAPRGVKASTFPSGLPLIRRARGRDDSIPLHSISGNDIVLVAMARIIKPPKMIERLREANHFEYKTRHLIDGRMIMVDQRISLVAGYMTDEVTGLSPFTFMHQDDVRWVIVALRQMYDSNSSYGESCYRLLTRTGGFIYLRTRGFLEIDKSTNQVHSFLCINSLVSEEEGRQRCQEMKNKFSIIVNANIPASNTDRLAVDNPQQLEKAVIYLIENLQKTARDVVDADEEFCNENEPSNKNSASCSKSLGFIGHKLIKSNTERLTKSPPLTLIPPNTSSIKSSISKSVTVVNTTAAKNFRISRAKNKSLSEDPTIKDDISSIEDDSNSSNSNNNSIFGFENDVAVKHHANEKTSFLYKNNNSGNNKNSNNRNNSSSSSNNYNSKSNYDDQQKKHQEDGNLSNILIKTENIDYCSDNENVIESRVPPLPSSSDYYEMKIITAPIDKTTAYTCTSNIIMVSSPDYKRTSPSSTSSHKSENELHRCVEQKHSDLKRIRKNFEDASDSCDSPSMKRLALDNSPIGLENISSSSFDNDQIFLNTSTTIQTFSTPQEKLTQLLPSSFSQIKSSLSHIKTATTELKRQYVAYADSKNQLEEIIDERDKQEELLENIQSEYEAHLLQHQGLTASPITTSDGSISLPLTSVLTIADAKCSKNSTNSIDFDTDDVLQRNINLNTR